MLLFAPLNIALGGGKCSFDLDFAAWNSWQLYDMDSVTTLDSH